MNTRSKVARAFSTRLPSASIRHAVRATDSIGGVIAVEYMPLRAKPSQTTSSTTTPASPRAKAIAEKPFFHAVTMPQRTTVRRSMRVNN